MILKIPYTELNGIGVRGTLNGKQQDFYLRVGVTQDNIMEAIGKLDKNKMVVAYDYTGDAGFLCGMEKPEKPVIATCPAQTVDLNLDMIAGSVPSWVRLVVQLPESYADMSAIEVYSQKFPNMRFCGGSFIRLPGCNIGCICADDLPVRLTPPVTTVGCACAFPYVEREDIGDFQFITEKVWADRAPKQASSKKPTSSLLKVAKSEVGVGFSNF